MLMIAYIVAHFKFVRRLCSKIRQQAHSNGRCLVKYFHHANLLAVLHVREARTQLITPCSQLVYRVE